MAREVDLKFLADTSDVISALERIPDVTKKQARAAAKAIATSQTQAAKASKKAARIAQREWDEKLGKIKTASATAFGDSINKVADLTAGLGAIGPAGGIATVGIAGIGLAAVGAVAGTISLVSATNDLIRSNEHLAQIEGFGFSAAEIRSVDDANAAMAGVSQIASQAAATIGVELAPVVERVSRLLLGLGLMGIDAMEGVAEGTGILTKAANRAINFALNPMAETILTLAEATAGWFLLLGKEVPDSLQGFIDSSREQINYVDDLDWAMGKVEKSLAGYGDRVDEIIDANYKQSESFKKASEAAEAHQKVMEGQVTALQKILAAGTTAQADQLSERERLRRDAGAAQMEVDRLALDAGVLGAEAAAAAKLEIEQRLARDLGKVREQELADEQTAQAAQVQAARESSRSQLETASKAVDATNTLFAGGADLFVALKGEESEAAKKAAKAQFRVNQLASLAQVAINTALGISTSMTLPPPASFINAGIVAASGIGSAASIAAQSPPSFHVGGLIGASGPNAPDETMIRARVGEGVVTRQGVDALTQINRGQAPGSGSTVVVQTYRHRVLDLQVQDEMRSPTGALRAATRQGKRVGHKKRVA